MTPTYSTTDTPAASQNGQASRKVTVMLGGHDYVIVPQRHGYLRSRLGKFFGQLTQGQNLSVADLPGHAAYALLKVFIPNVMPEYEFNGYTEEAWKKKVADERKIEKLREEAETLLADQSDEGRMERLERIDKIEDEVRKLREKDYYDEAADVSPTSDEIHGAITAGIAVNHFDLFKHLGNVLTPELLRGFVNQQAAELLTRT